MTNNRRIVLAIAAICLLPLIAAIVIYLGWPVQRHMNHGELMQTVPLPSTAFLDAAGNRYASEPLRGHWLLLVVQPPSCGEACRHKLYLLRQARAAQGENQERVARLWLLNGEGTPSAALLAEYPGLMVARAADPAWLAALPTKGDIAQHIYLIDPLGNLVLRYDVGLEPKGLINDLARVLRVSRIG